MVENDFCILITTHNRPNMLSDLITQINNQKKDYKVKIIVIDDGSDEKYELPKDVKYVKYYPNMGKKRFWKIIDSSFKYVKNINSKYYIYIQDDVKIVDNFFEDLVKNYETIEDNDKICLSLSGLGKVKF
jgi:glycosyltransferase involved in cell wall biosynthesis